MIYNLTLYASFTILDMYQSLPSIEEKPEYGCPDNIVSGYDWNYGAHSYGYCARTNKATVNKLENFLCDSSFFYTKSICQKPKERKIEYKRF